MINDSSIKFGPLVSILIPTFNRTRYLAYALASAVRQDYRNIQIIVVNDGGEDVSDVVQSFHDPRIVFINRKENRGKAFSLNQALTIADGKYIAYLDDDDLFYPDHIQKLVHALESQTDCRVAYSDLYKTYCRIMPDDSRLALSKVVEVSRDFDRFFMLYFNHVLHVSVMHSKDLLNKTGPYNENLNILIDWDMTRRLAFFSDFHHINDVTGEYYSPMGDCDRISVQQRKNKNNYLRNVLAIRTTRPPKPWTKLKDLSIIFTYDNLNKQAGSTIGAIWRNCFYPYQLILPLYRGDFNKLQTDMPNLVMIPLDHSVPKDQQINASLSYCQGDFVAVVPAGFSIREMTIENSLYVMMNCSCEKQAFELEDSTEQCWGVVLRKEDLRYARQNYPAMPLRRSLEACGINVRKPNFNELPFQFDELLKTARSYENDGNWLQAARAFEYIADNHHNVTWMKSLAAGAFYEGGCQATAASLCSELNQIRPTVDTLLLEAKIHKEKKEFETAVSMLHKAHNILEGNIRLWM